MSQWTATTTNAEETRALGQRIGALLQPGDVVLLQGPLGAGKTTLAQGIGIALGVIEHVTSPTFVLLTQHEGRMPLFHADLYRLGDSEEVSELELDTQTTEGVLLVEWPERGFDALPPEHLLLNLEPLPESDASPETALADAALEDTGAEHRRITITARGRRADHIVRVLAAITRVETAS